MHYFIFAKLVELLWLVTTRTPLLPFVILSDGKTMKCMEIYENCPIRMYEHEFLANLYRFELTDFRVVLGMDW